MSGDLTRREFLGRAAGVAGAAALAPLAGARPAFAAQQANRVKRVILIRFGGGVRLSETFAHPEPQKVIPFLHGLTRKGILYRNMRNEGRLDHVSATAQILTGRHFAEDKDIGKRLPVPTLFEYFRQSRPGSAERTLLFDPSWHPTHLDHSDHKDYGSGAAEILTRRITVWQMEQIQKQHKENEQPYKDAKALKEALLAEDFEGLSIQKTGGLLKEPRLLGGDNTKAEAYRKNLFEREKIPRTKIAKKAVRSGDMVTLFCVQRAFQDKRVDPQLMMINFHGPDVAHGGSYSDYLAAVSELDDVLRAFWEVSAKENKHHRSTAIIIAPDVGRDLGTMAGGFAGHRSGDLGCRSLFALCVVPGKRGGQVVDRYVRQTDICPTVGAWLGLAIKHADKTATSLSEAV